MTTDIANCFSFELTGEYYIQPILKEYDFVVRQGKAFSSPVEYALSVVEGGSLNVELVGKRVAYSAFGEVSHFSNLGILEFCSQLTH